MRIIVDEMPKNPLGCRLCNNGYCFFNNEYCWLLYGKDCPYLKEFKHVEDDCK
jgi:hypothetical protein